jgi:hypothetical protein
VLIYFGLSRSYPLLGFGAIAVLGVVLVWTAPNRWGVGIALHYLSRVFWPDPEDPVPPAAGGLEVASDARTTKHTNDNETHEKG